MTKQLFKPTKRLLSLLVMLIVAVSTFAQSFTVGDLTYEVTSTTDKTVRVSDGSNATGDVIVPETVTYNDIEYAVKEIGAQAFYGNKNITSVSTPSVTTIGTGAFYSCSSLCSVSLPVATRIGINAFYSCSSLTSVSLTAATSINGYAFYNCTSLTSVTLTTVTYIGNYAFSNCKKISSIRIGSIEQWCNVYFEGYWSNPLSYTSQSVDLYIGESDTPVTNIEVPNTVTNIPEDAFRYTTITSINAPAATSIGTYAFDNCKSLTSVSLPAITSIGVNAFENCKNINALRIGSIEQWCNADFGNNAANPLSNTSQSVDLYIGDSDTPVTNIEVPSTVTNIPNCAFRYTTITSINAPTTTSIGSSAFRSCSSLTSVSLPATTSIGNSAFYRCSSLESISLSSAITTIGGDAFNYCSKITTVNYSGTLAQWCGIKFENASSSPCNNGKTTFNINDNPLPSELNIPEGIESIGAYAFYGITQLKKVSIPKTVTNIGDYAFNAKSLAWVYMDSDIPASIASTNCFYKNTIVLVNDNKVNDYRNSDVWSGMRNQIFGKSIELTEVTTHAENGKMKLLEACGGIGNEQNIINLKVHGTLNGYDIMVIRNKMTNLRCLDLSDATIVEDEDHYQYYTGYYTQNNVFGAYSFYDCDNIRTIALPKNITSIDNYAMAGCNNLISVTNMPETCTSIGQYAFYSSSLNDVSIGTGVTSIGDLAFHLCSDLINIVIPASVRSIGSEAFWYCTSLENIKFEEGLETIGAYAFQYCSSIKDLKLPITLKRIGNDAFYGCTSLTAIHIPSMLTYIGDNAFTGCGVKDVYAYTLAPINISQNTFNFEGVLHAPQEPYSVFFDYYTNTQWSQFTNVVPFDAKYSTWYTGEDKDITVGDGETIPNENEDEAEGEMKPGSGLIYEGCAFQWLYKLYLKWKEGRAPSLVDNGNVFVDELVFNLDVQANKWYFFCFPFDIDLDKAKYNGKYVWRYYDGEARANGQGAWKNVGGNKLEAYKGYIFQTNKAGEIELTISSPVFTTDDKNVTLEQHTSGNAQDASWNFIGNPELCHFDLSTFIDKFNAPITVWDPVNNTYNAVMPGDDDYEFQPFQAFFVQKPADISAMEFSKNDRETYVQKEEATANRAKSRATRTIDSKRRLVNLTISNGTMTDKTRVVFNDEKSMDYESGCDAGKFFSSESVPQIYTLDGKQNKYAINQRPNQGNTVSIGYVAAQDGTYSISAQRMDMLMALKDNETGAVHDFADGEYIFDTKAGTYDGRFTLMPSVGGTTGINTLINEGIIVETSNGGITLGGLNGRTASVYTVGGAMVATIAETGHADLGSGTYIVTVGDKSSKVVVK